MSGASVKIPVPDFSFEHFRPAILPVADDWFERPIQAVPIFPFAPSSGWRWGSDDRRFFMKPCGLARLASNSFGRILFRVLD